MLLQEICSDASKNFDGEKRLIVKLIIKKLHHPHCPNPTIKTETVIDIIDIYEKEYCDFDKKSGIFANRANFLIHLIQLKTSLTFDMSFILTHTQKSLVLLHLEQLPSILALDLLNNHGVT